MIIDDKIRIEKLQGDINRKVAKKSALSSGKINRYEYLTGKDCISFFRKSFSKTIEGQET